MWIIAVGKIPVLINEVTPPLIGTLPVVLRRPLLYWEIYVLLRSLPCIRDTPCIAEQISLYCGHPCSFERVPLYWSTPCIIGETPCMYYRESPPVVGKLPVMLRRLPVYTLRTHSLHY